ncbi:MAG: hypothetical protein HWE13_06190 [Gammaproteobacteria bacterium]|nr:hypothetical protein [Gammaproteobacteria bacterium]NVK87694.1 hypothetical protein [Gammaproteobacteria bacterium]
MKKYFSILSRLAIVMVCALSISSCGSGSSSKSYDAVWDQFEWDSYNWQ